MRKKILLYFLVIFLVWQLCETKRSGGRGRGSSSSGGFWSRKKTVSKPLPQKPVQQPKPVQQLKPEPVKPKPSAPKEETVVKKENSNVQQNQRPIGWNDQNLQKTQVGQNMNAPPPYSPHHAPPGYSAPGAPPPNYNPHQAPPSYSPGSYPHQAPPGYYAPGSYPNQQSPMYSPGGYPQQPGGYPHQPGGYPHQPGGYPYQSGAYPQAGGFGGYPQGYPNSGYHPQMNPYGMGMQGGYPQKSGGFFGNLFGGNKGYGGYGGYGMMGPYGYGMKKSGGFLGGLSFRNILAGMLIWHVVSGLTRTPYKIYNHNNRPEEIPDIQLPPNMLTLCNENVTDLCVPGTTPICTTNNTFLCVTTVAATVPCPDGMCVNSTIPCIDKGDPLCQNSTNEQNTTSVNMPCFTNVTLDYNLLDFNKTTQESQPEGSNKKYTYCVTTLAIGGAEEPICQDPAVNGTTTTTAENKPCVNMTEPILFENINQTLPLIPISNITNENGTIPTANPTIPIEHFNLNNTQDLRPAP